MCAARPIWLDLSGFTARFLRVLGSSHLIISICAIPALSGIASAAPVIAGLHQKHPLTEAQQGAVLIEELKCASCHESLSARPAKGPDLQDLSARVKPDFLKSFIQHPAQHDPGTAMPNLLGGLSAEDQEKTATALSAYLLSLKTPPASHPTLPKDEAQDGKKLFHEIGCVSCHSPRDGNEATKNLTGFVNLDHVSKKYHPAGLAEFLHEPLKVRPDGRMPDMRLSRSEAELLAAFMVGTPEETPKPDVHSAEIIASGKKAFTEMRCAACHETGDKTVAPLAPLPPKPKLDLNAGCLSEKPGKAPDYELSEQQRAVIRIALTEKSDPPSAAESVKLRLTQLNCISCHQRDDYGGVKPELDSYFHSTEEALGNHARIPPELTLTGAKLQSTWLNKVLYEGETVRPYMITRMPQFGDAALDGLHKLFGEVDKMPPLEFAPPDNKSKHEMSNAAHRLLGDQGLNCIACHNYNGKESPSMKGLDIMTSAERLQPAWFDQFLRNPAKFRPGIIMPSYWPDDKAVQTEILGGNADEQIRALWYEFTLGRSARDPSGLRSEDPELIVTDQTRTYRGRSTVAGYRGIAVGYPGGMNYAFNAHNGAFSALWTGKFVKVGWRGQGSGNFTPAAPVVQLAEDVAFLTKLPEAWPLRPVRTKEAPVNPDPTYPSQYGYRFQGYTIGENGVPTFRYQCDEVEIEDSSLSTDNNQGFKRTLNFNTPKATTVYFRVLTGKIEAISETSYKIPKLQLGIGTSTAKLSNMLRSAAVDQELILKLDLPSGTTTLSLDYVLLP